MPRTLTAARPTRARWPKGAAPPVLVEMRRGTIVESRHRGHIVQVGADGEIQRALGDPDTVVTMRSTVKPFTLVAVIESGAADAFSLTDAELAVMAASHSGEDMHVRTLQAVFRRSGLTQSLLACGATGMPLDPVTASRLARDGEAPGAVRHMCSGHHAASLLLSRHAGWPLEDYWLPDHPSQVAARAALARVLGVRPLSLSFATDSCGVPTYAVSLLDIARAYVRLADPLASLPATAVAPASAPAASNGGGNGFAGRLRAAKAVTDDSRSRLASALIRVRDAMLAAPEMVGGSRGRLDTALVKAAPDRIVSKSGAEGLRGIAIAPVADGGTASGLAVKIDDGDGRDRASHAVTVEALAQVGALDDGAVRELAEYHRPQTLDPRGDAIGEAVPTFQLAPISELL